MVTGSTAAHYFTFADHLGNISAISDSGGAFYNNSYAQYKPFGAYHTEPTTNPGLTDRGFTGHRHNNTGTYDLGLIYMNARYYMPEIGRFISADTMVPDPQTPQTYNRYSYVRNNPINLTDPTGHRECVMSCSDEMVNEQELRSASAWYGSWDVEQQELNRAKAEDAAFTGFEVLCSLYDPCDYGFTGTRVLAGKAGPLETIALGVPFVPGIVGRLSDDLIKWAARYGDDIVAVLRGASNVVPIANRAIGGTGQAYNRLTGQGVYVLLDTSDNIVYIGRGDVPARLNAHSKSDILSAYRQLIVANNNLSYSEARGLEQLLIDYAGGTEALLNVYNGISPSNPLRNQYLSAGLPLLSEALSKIAAR